MERCVPLLICCGHVVALLNESLYQDDQPIFGSAVQTFSIDFGLSINKKSLEPHSKSWRATAHKGLRLRVEFVLQFCVDRVVPFARYIDTLKTVLLKLFALFKIM